MDGFVNRLEDKMPDEKQEKKIALFSAATALAQAQALMERGSKEEE